MLIWGGTGQGPGCRALTRTFVVGTAGLEPATSASRTLPGRTAMDRYGLKCQVRAFPRRLHIVSNGNGRAMDARWNRAHVECSVLPSRSSDVDEPANGLADDLAGSGVVGFGSRLDRCPKLWVDPNRHDVCWS